MRLEQLLLLCFRWGNWGLTGIKYSPGASLVAQWVKNLPAMQEMLKMWVWSLGWEDAKAEEMATHFSILAWKIPYTEEPDGLQPKGSQRVRYGWTTKHKHIVCNASKNHVGAAGKARLIPEISCASRWGTPTSPHLLWLTGIHHSNAQDTCLLTTLLASTHPLLFLYLDLTSSNHYFANKVPSSQGYVFSSGHVWMWELDCEESWAPKNWCFWIIVLEKTLGSPLDCKEIQPVHPKGDQSWVFIGRTDTEAETPVLWPPDAKRWLIGKDPDAGRDWGQEEKGTTEDEMAGWHYRLDGHEFE